MSEKQVDSQTGEKYVQREGSLRVVEVEFGGQYKGLRYNVPQFVADVPDNVSEDTEDGKALISEKSQNALVDAIAKYGSAKVLYLFNNALSNNTRNKVSSTRIPHFDDKVAEKKKLEEMIANSPEIFSVDEAADFIPGVREITSSGYMNLAKKAKSEGNMELFRSYMEKAIDAADREAALSGQG